eukprot:4049151-Prymnesium_polylepis.1
MGSSGGGMVAQELCLRAPPGLVRSLSLCVTYSGGDLVSILPPVVFHARRVVAALAAADEHGG